MMIEKQPEEGVSNAALLEYDYKYRYPGKLKLRPGTEFHDDLVERLLSLARISAGEMVVRHADFRRMDDAMRGYVPRDDEEKEIKKKEPGKAVSVSIPALRMARDILHTYLVAEFLEKDPLFEYEPVGPEDVAGAAMIETLIQRQVTYGDSGLALSTMLLNDITYGIGPIAVRWKREVETSRQKVLNPIFDPLTGQQIGAEPDIDVYEDVTFEGNVIDAIDPYKFLPDPSVPIHEIQRMRFVGWMSTESRMEGLGREKSEADGWFNARYLKHIAGTSGILAGDGRRDLDDEDDEQPSPLEAKRSARSVKEEATASIDTLHIMVELVPEDWGLGEGDMPERWAFAVGGDQVLLRAERLGFDHGCYPVMCSASSYDGFSVAPLSALEPLLGMQDVINWLFNSHIKNVRKALNDMLIYDPYMVHGPDIENPEPGKLIRLRRAAWGRPGAARDSIHQLPVQDVTRQHMGDASGLLQTVKEIAGSTDAVNGNRRNSSGRVTAEEARGSMQSALSRMEKSARIIFMQVMRKLAHLMASQTKQFMSMTTYVSIAGRWPQVLEAEMGVALGQPRVAVSPFDISVNTDVKPYEGGSNRGRVADGLVEMFRIIAGDEILKQEFDVGRMASGIARASGLPNLDVYRRPGLPAGGAPLALPAPAPAQPAGGVAA